MSKDVIVDRYARLYEIPKQLARAGHEVRAYCLGYQGQEEGEWHHDSEPGSVTWISTSLGLSSIIYPRFLLRQLFAYKPDILIAASDIVHIILGKHLAQRLRVPLFVDLYDNFEGFGQARIPFFVYGLRTAVASAHFVTTTSELLRDFVIQQYHPTGNIVAMPSAIDGAVFRVRDKRESRLELGLPVNAQLIGTAGGLYRDKGIDLLLQAWDKLQKKSPDAHLVLAGPLERGLALPKGERVHYLGALSHEKVAHLFSALDVGLICVLDSLFGRYSFPQKAYEMLACRLPVVASGVGAMNALFSRWPSCLAEANDIDDMVEKIISQLTSPILPDIEIKDWRGQVSIIDAAMRDFERKSEIHHCQ